MKGVLKQMWKKKRKIFYSKSDDMPIIKSNRLKACYARINIW